MTLGSNFDGGTGATGDTDERVREWIANCVSEADAQVFMQARVSPDVARDAFAQGLTAQDAAEYLTKGASISEALQFQQRGILPTQVIPGDDGGFTLDIDPWQVDPADDMPAVIEPGRIAVTVWSDALGGDPTAYDVSFRWDGGHIAEWYEDISMMNDLSFASSSPTRGVLAWPNGRDVQLTFSWVELDLYGHDTLAGLAPTNTELSGKEIDPRQWIRLAKALVDFVLLDLGSRSSVDEDWAEGYFNTKTEVVLDLDDVFREYLDEVEGDNSVPDFRDWLAEGLRTGAYEVPDD